MDKTMKSASEEAEAQVAEGEEATSVPEEVQTETSEPQQDQVTTGEEEAQANESSDETPITATTDFDPVAFIDSLEVESLTPEQKQSLKDGYLRQADYTRKTQDAASQRKLAEEYSTFKPYIEKVLADEKLYAQVFGDSKAEEEQDTLPDDPEEYAKLVEGRAVERAKTELREEIRQGQVEQAMEQDRIQASQLDPRLNSDQGFAEEIGGILALNQDFIEGSKTATQATQEALEIYKQREARYRAKFTTDLQMKAKAKTMVFPQSRGLNTSSNSPSSRPSSMAEAAQIAEKEIETL